MFEYVAADLIARDAGDALTYAIRKAEAAGFAVNSVKRVTEKRGRTATFTVVLMVNKVAKRRPLALPY